MKTVLPISNFTFTPSLNQVNFSPMGGAFKRQNLYAVINITTGKLIYAVASVTSGFGGTFAGNILTYASSNAGQLNTDVLQVIYDDENAVQIIAGSVTIQDPANVKGVVGTASAVASAIHDGSGTLPILSTPDPLTLREGLDIHVQSASVQGLLNNPLPLPYQNQALSVGYINGGDLVTPAMNIGTNELIVDATQSGPIPVDITGNSGPITVDIGTAPTLDVNILSTSTTVPVSAASLPLPTGAATETTLAAMSAKLPATLGQKSSAQSMAVVLPSDQIVSTTLPDLFITGASAQTATVNNIISNPSGAAGTDASGYRSGSIQVVSTGTAGTFAFESSNDNVNWVAMPVVNSSLINGAMINAAITATASQIVYSFPITGRYIRLRIVTTITGGSIQAFTRLSQAPFTASTQAVGQSTGTNLNVAVSTVTSSNTAIPNSASDVASAALTTTTTTATITPSNGVAYQVVIPVTVVGGTNPTLDVSIEESDDTGTNWVRVYDFPRITGTGVYRSGPIKLRGNRVRYVQTVGGTSPSFTRSIQRLQRSDTIFSRLTMINRTIDPNTLNSTSTVLYCDGASEFNYYIRCTAQTTAATIQIQFSDDNTNWYSPATATLTTINGIVKGQIADEYWRFARAIVTAAGSGITLGEFSLKAARE